MKLQERNIRKETEKALYVAVALKSSDNGTYTVVNGIGGFYYEVAIWIPKSVVKDEEIPAWIISKNMKEKGIRLCSINDIVLHEDVQIAKAI
jgi:hypothetical protein